MNCNFTTLQLLSVDGDIENEIIFCIGYEQLNSLNCEEKEDCIVLSFVRRRDLIAVDVQNVW
jgi:hypothetical protein